MIQYPNYPGLTTGSLGDLHDSIKKAMSADDATPEGQGKPYGVREYPDWKEHADRIEQELDSRDEKYEKIDWTMK